MIHLVDLRLEQRAGNYSPLSETLQEHITKALADKKQVLLFLNRRGTANSLLCKDCGTMIYCDACDVTMTYHRKAYGSRSSLQHYLMCHYCGKTTHVPDKCPECQSHKLKPLGVGTQSLEEETKKRFPQARVGRLDRDTTTQKHSHQDTLDAFLYGDLDILIGTQMLTKGHDFPNVAVIGIVLADIGLGIPDFRAKERLYQTLTQVAGRTGRRGVEGDIILQTYNPEDITSTLADEQSYETFITQEIEERKTFGYPPFGKLIKLTYVHPERDQALKASKKLRDTLETLEKTAATQTTISLAPAMIPKQHHKYHINIFLKGANPRTLLQQALPLPREWRIDIDPISTA